MQDLGKVPKKRRPEPRVPPTAQPQPPSAPLPVNGRGRPDLDRLSQPLGISIPAGHLQPGHARPGQQPLLWEAPQRMFFPSRDEPPPPGVPKVPLGPWLPNNIIANPATPDQVSNFFFGSPSNFPAPPRSNIGGNNGNVTAVDTNSLRTRAEEEQCNAEAANDRRGKKGKNKN